MRIFRLERKTPEGWETLVYIKEYPAAPYIEEALQDTYYSYLTPREVLTLSVERFLEDSYGYQFRIKEVTPF